jgi:hypothetical protein
MDPLEMLKNLASSSLVYRDPEGTIKVLKQIIALWENERGSHDASIDILQDEIVKQENELKEFIERLEEGE